MDFIETKLKPLYPNREFTTDAQGVIKIDVALEELVGMLTRFHNEAGFEVLSTISCTDWIEEGNLHLNYILYSYEFNQTLFLKVKFPRELKDDGSKVTVAELPSVHTIWCQASNYERELWEMYGVNVTGHNDLREFFLEDWQGPPPNRRDFDTLEFVNETFEFRPGREDAKSVKEERAKHAAARKAAKAAEEAKKAQAETPAKGDNTDVAGGKND